MKQINRLLDFLSDFLAKRKGLLPLIGLILILLNLLLHFIRPDSLLVEAEVLLSLGVILAIIGVLLAWAL